MGQYFKIVNLTKREYFSASVFNEGIKQSDILLGKHAYALGKLITIGIIDKNPKLQIGNHYGLWLGYWAGDKIAVIGDETPDEFFGVEPQNPETKAIILYDIIKHEFTNIGGKIICWLVNDKEFARHLIETLQNDEKYIGDLGYITYKYPEISEELINFLKNLFGKNWEKKCKLIWEDKKTNFIEPDV